MKINKGRFISHLILLVAVLCIGLSHYTSGSYLSGWDNLQTELHPSLGIKRAYYSVWQEYQSFGLLAGMAHGTDLIRSSMIYGLSFVFPQNSVRLVSFLIFLFAGLQGMYAYVGLLKKPRSHELIRVAAALFYGLGFGFIQLSYVPFEPFSYFFACFPWLLYSFHLYITKGRPYFLRFFAINMLAIPSYYIQTLFVSYMLFLALYSCGFIVQKHVHVNLKRLLIGFLIICIINASWLIPQLYFLQTSGSVVQDSKINQLATLDVHYQNESHSTLTNFLKQSGFYFTLRNQAGNQLFNHWQAHFETIYGKTSVFLLVALVVLGIFTWSSSHRYIIGPLIGVSVLLLPNLPPFSYVNSFVRSIPLIDQMYRSPFTKVSVLQSFIFSFAFYMGASSIYHHISTRSLVFRRVFLTLLISLVLMSALPAFRGHFFAPEMRVTIPQDYLDAISYFKTVDSNQRITLLPDSTFWGWFYTDWGYNGSGFLWYGIEQPIVSRTFDVWSKPSESYFWEMKTALESERIVAVEAVLDKYAIDYIILDRSLLPVSSGVKALQYDAINRLLAQSPHITQFGDGSVLSLYRFTRPTYSPDRGFVDLTPGSIPTVLPHSDYIPADTAFATLGQYRSPVENEAADVMYPFQSLMSSRRMNDDQWELRESAHVFTLIGRIPGSTSLADYAITTPDESSAPTKTDIITTSGVQQVETKPIFEVDAPSRTITATFPKNIIQTLDPVAANLYPCQQETTPTPLETDDRVRIEKSDSLLRIASTNGAIPCIGYSLPELPQNYGYLVRVRTAHIEGRPLFIAITDDTKQQPIIEDRLDTSSSSAQPYSTQLFIIPPRFEFGQGYTVTFQNTSYAGIPSTNSIASLDVFALPYTTLAQLKLTRTAFEPVISSTQERIELSKQVTSHKRAYHAYTVDVTHQGLKSGGYLVLHQAFHSGWKAYVVPKDGYSQYMPWLVGKQLPESSHVRINGWAQGWKLPESCEKARGDCRIVLLFPMQYAVPLGLLVTGTLFAVLIYRTITRRIHTSRNNVA